MQGLVYIFVALSALAIGAAGRFGLNLSIVESIMAGLIFGCIAVIYIERMLRYRAEARLERGIEDLSRLLSTDAQAGGVLSQRINALVDENAGSRLDGLEADISVLGTVVRQVAEAVADIEDAKNKPAAASSASAQAFSNAESDDGEVPLQLSNEPRVSLADLQKGMAEDRLLFHVEPIVTLPQRRTHSYDLVPRLRLEDDEIVNAPEFMPLKGGDAVVRRIEGLGLHEAISMAHRARSSGQSITLYVPLSHATLSDPLSVEQLLVTLDANRAIVASIIARIDASVWNELTPAEKLAVGLMGRKGLVVSLTGVNSLRLDFPDLSALGVRSIRFDTTRFIEQPETLTDLHTTDVAGFVRRANIELIATGLTGERQILSLLDDGIGLVQGPYIAGPGPLRVDQLVAPSAEGARRA